MSRLVPFVLEPQKSSNMPDRPVRRRYVNKMITKNTRINVAIFVPNNPGFDHLGHGQICLFAPSIRIIASKLPTISPCLPLKNTRHVTVYPYRWFPFCCSLCPWKSQIHNLHEKFTGISQCGGTNYDVFVLSCPYISTK